MSEAFDPYHRWLGIAPKDQPPHHYRLLGIDLFEDDPEVIRDATERQMAHVRKYQLGQHSAISQKILNEIAAARGCLLDREKRAAYDAAIKTKLSAGDSSQTRLELPILPRPASPSPPPAPFSSTAKQLPLSTVNAAVKAKTTIFTGEKSSKGRKKNWSPYIGLGTTVFLGGILAAIFMFVLRDNNRASPIPASNNRIAQITDRTKKTSNQHSQTQTGTYDKPVEQANTGTLSKTSSPTDIDVPADKHDAAAKDQDEGFPSTAKLELKPDIIDEKPKTNKPLQQSKTPVTDIEKPLPGENTLSPGESSGKLVILNHPRNKPDYSPGPAISAITLNLPSGKIFNSQFFDIDLKSVEKNLENKFNKLLKDNNYIGQVILLGSPNSSHTLSEQDQGKPDGVLLAFYNNQHPQIYANYKDGKRNGIIKMWNEYGDRVYWCQYDKGIRHGFCCYFNNNILRILFEINHNKYSAVHVCSNGNLIKSFDSFETAVNDEDAKMLINEANQTESELKSIENDYKKQINNEFKNIQQKLIGEKNKQKRDAILDNMRKHAEEWQNGIIESRRKAGL